MLNLELSFRMSGLVVSVGHCTSRTLACTHVNCGFIVFDATQNLEPAKLPLSAFRRIYRSHFQVSVDRGCIGVDELDGSLNNSQPTKYFCVTNECPRTAILCKPHFIVSGARLFLRTCHRNGTTRSVAIYM